MSDIEQRIKEIAERKEALIKLVDTEVFRNGIHYRQYGRNKRLLLAGLELMMQLHELSEESCETVETDLGEGHREFRCYSKVSDKSGKLAGSGLRACSTREERFRYDFRNTGKRPSLKYLVSRDSMLLEGNTEEDPNRMVVRDSGGKATIFERIDCENPGKNYNMVAALAHKRAKMAAVINAIGGTDLFEIEDEVLTVDYVKHLEKAESLKDSGEPEEAVTPLEPAAKDRFSEICLEDEDRANSFLVSRDCIEEGETWRDIGENHKTVMMKNEELFVRYLRDHKFVRPKKSEAA